MHATKREKLKAELSAQSEAPIVAIERYFDGNGDEASIGCNLMEHPGIELQPDEVGPAEDFGIPEGILAKHKAPVLAAWWD